MILSWLAIILAVVGILLTLMTAALQGFYFGSVPTGSNAMGLVIPFFTAIAAGLAAMAAGAWAGSRGGLDWLGLARGPATALLVGAALLVGVAVVGALLAWSERHALGRPVLLLISGLVLPLGFLSFLFAIARGDPAGLPGSSGVRALGAVAALAMLAGIVTTGFLIQAHARKFFRDQARLAELRKVEQAEADRVEALTPEQKLRESLADYSPTAPLWTVVAGLPDEPSPSLRAILVERALIVPEFEAELAQTITCQYGNYRHGCVVLIAEAPEAVVKREPWAELLAREAVLTAQDIRQAGDLGRHGEDPLAQHIATWVRASARVERVAAWSEGLRALRAAVAGLSASAEQTAALAALDSLTGKS